MGYQVTLQDFELKTASFAPCEAQDKAHEEMVA